MSTIRDSDNQMMCLEEEEEEEDAQNGPYPTDEIDIELERYFAVLLLQCIPGRDIMEVEHGYLKRVVDKIKSTTELISEHFRKVVPDEWPRWRSLIPRIGSYVVSFKVEAIGASAQRDITSVCAISCKNRTLSVLTIYTENRSSPNPVISIFLEDKWIPFFKGYCMLMTCQMSTIREMSDESRRNSEYVSQILRDHKLIKVGLDFEALVRLFRCGMRLMIPAHSGIVNPFQ